MSVSSTENGDELKSSGSRRRDYLLGILGVVLTVGIVVTVACFWESVRELEEYSYIGAFIISIVGGATIIVPVPMTPVVFALGGVMKYTWLVGLAAGLGETLGAVIIYITGRGGASPLAGLKPGKVQAFYLKLMNFMDRRGSLTLFILSAVLNPFFYPAAITAGALRFDIRKYFIICLVGKIIKGMTVAYAGFWGLGSLLRWMGIPV